MVFAGFFEWVFISGIYARRGRVNGAPFHVGDTVQILAGPYRGRIARVYSSGPGDLVRVELGDERREKRTDIFPPERLLREDPAAEPPGPPSPPHDGP
ncbi:MAG: KOW motif-containing protein [Candidatus Hydrogenedentes bacterium]|nr:KOW motif-containing protein [Candidatus Hydrogenedentota bacterium]